MWANLRQTDYRRSFILSIVVHIAIIIFLLVGFASLSSQTQLFKKKNPDNIINAIAVNQTQVEQQVNQIKNEQLQKQLQQQQHLAQLKQQQQQMLAQKQLQQQQQAQIKAQQQQLAQIKQEQAEELKKLQQIKIKQQQQPTPKPQNVPKQAQAAPNPQPKINQQQLAAQQQQQQLEQQFEQQVAAEQAKLAKQRQQQVQQQAVAFASQISSAVKRNWLYLQSDSNLSCVLRVSLEPNGTVTDVTVVKSSGNTAFDRSAIAAVYKTSPLPVPSDAAVYAQIKTLDLTMVPDSAG